MGQEHLSLVSSVELGFSSNESIEAEADTPPESPLTMMPNDLELGEGAGHKKVFKVKERRSDRYGSVGWVSVHKLKGHQFSQSGQMPGLQVLSPVGARARGNPSM